MVMSVLMGEAEKKQRQFRSIGFTIKRYTDEENTKETKVQSPLIFTSLCFLAKYSETCIKRTPY